MKQNAAAGHLAALFTILIWGTTFISTKVLLEDGISIGGKHMREIYEVVNHQNAYRYVKECIEKKMPLDEKIVKDIHAMLMEHIFTGGIYRNIEVYISGAQHTPPPPNQDRLDIPA